MHVLKNPKCIIAYPEDNEKVRGELGNDEIMIQKTIQFCGLVFILSRKP